MSEATDKGHEGHDSMRRVLWGEYPVYVVQEPQLAAQLEELARRNPARVRMLTPEEAAMIIESFSLNELPTLREIRRERDLSQNKLSEMSGVNSRSISEIERHRWMPAHKTIERLCDALGVRPRSVAEFAVARRRESARVRPLSTWLPEPDWKEMVELTENAPHIEDFSNTCPCCDEPVVPPDYVLLHDDARESAMHNECALLCLGRYTNPITMKAGPAYIRVYGQGLEQYPKRYQGSSPRSN